MYDEAVTLILSRAGHGPARRLGKRIRGRGEYPDATDLLVVDRSIFERAIDTFEMYGDQRLSFTDATTIALVEAHDIDHVLAFDDDFDGIVSRLAPARA